MLKKTYVFTDLCPKLFDDRRGAFVFRTEPWAAVLRFPYGDGTVAVAGLEYELSVIFASTAVTT